MLQLRHQQSHHRVLYKKILQKLECSAQQKINPFCTAQLFVVYFDQRTGAPHAVCWLKSIF